VWRYLAIATALVVTIAALVVRFPSAPRTERASTYSSDARATPGVASRDDGPLAGAAVSGEAPWALSALPGCFREVRRARGPLAFVRATLPPGATHVRAGTTLRIADCTLTIGHQTAVVSRGENRFTVPAVARFSRSGGLLILERDDGPLGDVRVYAPRAHVFESGG